MNSEKILVCITNHNYNENSIELKNNFSKFFETIIIDSKSDTIVDSFDIKLENVYYTGLFNESVKQCKERGKEYLFFIASDVYVEDYSKIAKIIGELDDSIYLWAPSSRGQSHLHCKNKKTKGYRECPYLEGFTFLSKIECCDFIYPVDITINKYGYGIDLLLGFNCIKNLRKKCVVDDRVEVYHKEGTGYNQGNALHEMYNWMYYCFDNPVKDYTVFYSTSPGADNLLKKLKA